MAKNKFNKLFWQISICLFLYLTFISIAYIYTTIHYSERYSKEVNQLLNRNVAGDIVSHSTPFSNGEVNRHEMEKLFDHVMSINPSLEVYLLDKSGKILSFYAPEQKIVLDTIDIAPIDDFITNNGMKYICGTDPRHPELEKIFSVAPIKSSGQTEGYIYVVLAGEEYDSISGHLMGNYLIQVGWRSFLTTLLATLLVGLIMIRIFTRNLSRIVEVMEKFRKGDLKARVEMKSAGEVKKLGEIFNEMADILTQNIEKLNEVEILRRELIANVSHDLRTPIAIIHGYIETLQMKAETLSNEERIRYLNIISESTAKLEKLVHELFELSKLEANQVTPKSEAFSISELVNDVCMKYQIIGKEKNIEITDIVSKNLPVVYADVSLIERVLQNLMDNAIKFTPEKGKIVMKTFLKESNICVSVSDTGIGIPDQDKDKIFSRYYTSKNYSELKKSSGLGLAIVKKILDLHQSSLSVESKQNEGTTFTFFLEKFKGKN